MTKQRQNWPQYEVYKLQAVEYPHNTFRWKSCL